MRWLSVQVGHVQESEGYGNGQWCLVVPHWGLMETLDDCVQSPDGKT